MNFCDILKDILKDRGVKQKELCAASGITAATVSGYTTGQVIPRADRIQTLAEALGMPPAALLADDPDMRALIVDVSRRPGLAAALRRLIETGPEQLEGAAAVIEVLQAVQAGE